jgi:hypothetical protein
MKAKHVLYLAIIVGLLAPMSALPVLAEGDGITMWVHRARVAYTGRSPHGPDAVVAFIHVRDVTLDMVEGATVAAEWTLPDGSTIQEEMLTNGQGIAEFRLWEGRGDYMICVTGVTKVGWSYDPTLDREACPVFTVP